MLKIENPLEPLLCLIVKTSQRGEQKKKENQNIYIVMAHFNEISNQMLTGSSTALANTANEMRKLVKSFNEMMKEQVREDFVYKINSLKDEIATYGEENIHKKYFSTDLMRIFYKGDFGRGVYKFKKVIDDYLAHINKDYSRSLSIELRLYAFMQTLPMYLKAYYPTTADNIVKELKNENIWND